MKKLLLLLLSVVFTLQTQATHLMGGQITSSQNSGLYYLVKLTLYRDSLGVPMSPTQQITYTDSTGNFIIATHTVSYVIGSFPVSIGNGVERYEFEDTITFPYVGKFKAMTDNCCRNAAILNLPNPSQNSLWLDVEITADPSNSSPVFLNEPITVAQLNQPFSYNPLPFDVDGDSLSWQLDVPMDYFSPTLGTPIPGYVLPPSDTLAPFSIDPLTGEITFIPNVVGNFQVSVKAIEWRNGIQIGYIRRDMQLLVVPSTNTPVQVMPNYTIQKTLLNPIYLEPNQTFNLNVVTYDIDFNPISVNVGGSIFLVNNNPAIIVSNNPYTVNSTYSTTTTEISWTPTQNEIRTTPYYLSFRVADYSTPYTFYNDYTFRIVVKSSVTGFNQIENTKNKKLVRTVDMLGRNVDPESSGFRINIYSDGSKEKIYIKK
jgi:hypothetical protein